jgi:VWFA-related protein
MPHIVSKPHIIAGLSAALLLFPFSVSTYSQTAAAGPASAAVNPAEVTVEVTAHDKKGNTVSNLTPADVEVTDGGVAVSLTSLRLAAETQETITFVFDQVVSGVANTDRDLAWKLLTAVSGHGYRFAVLRIENRLHLVQAPTTDVAAVRKAIEAATVADRAAYIQATEAAEKQMTADCDSATGARQAAAKALLAMLMDSQKTAETDAKQTPSTAALLAAARGQQEVPGRKAILYFSQGLAWDKSSPETLRDIARAANRARASLYSFDADIGDVPAGNAMSVAAVMGTERALGNLAAGQSDSSGAATVGQEFAGRMQTGEGAVDFVKSLAGICQSTGGAKVPAMGSEARRGVGEIAMDLTSYYLASWISTGSGDDTGLRAITVKPLRKGVTVGSRAGYYPMRGGSVERVSGVESKLLAALALPQLPAALPVRAALLRYGNTPDNDVNSVLVEVPFDQLETKGGQGGVSVLAQLKDPSGAVVRKFSADVTPRRTVDDPGKAAPDIVGFRRQFTAPPGEYVLESVAMDSNGGKAGARRANVTIPAQAQGLALGDVLLVRRIDAANPGDEADPLRCVKGIVVPNLSGRVSKAASPQIDLFFDLHADPASKDTPALTAELRRGAALVGSTPLQVSVDPQRPTIPYLTTLGASGLRTGEYEMTIVLSQGGQKVSRTVGFTLE